MIVVSLMGVLSVVAIPAYNNYVAKSQVMEAFVLFDGARTAILDAYEETGVWNDGTTNTSNPFDTPLLGSITTKGHYVSSIVTGFDSNVLQVYLKATISPSANPLIANQTITYSYNEGASVAVLDIYADTYVDPSTAPGYHKWSCDTSIPQGLVPKSCQAMGTAPEPEIMALLYFGFISLVLSL